MNIKYWNTRDCCVCNRGCTNENEIKSNDYCNQCFNEFLDFVQEVQYEKPHTV